MAHAATEQPMRVAVSGASGMIGTALVSSLRADGHRVHRLVRPMSNPEPDDVEWNPRAGQLDAAALEGVNAVVNLAGARLDQRWSESVKRELYDSRADATMLLARTIASLSRPPRVLVNAAAIGVYGDRGDEELDESSSTGDDFLATLVRDWETATAAAAAAGTRVVLARSGIVLSPAGGALRRMLLPFRLGVGGRLGPGTQWMSWISLEDEVRALRFAIARDLTGPANLTAPNPVTNEELAKTLGRVLGRPALMPVPAVALELMFGAEMARNTLLASQRVRPKALLAAGFEFAHPTLEGALRSMLVD